MGGGALIVSFNYPLLEQREKVFAKDFFKTALNSKENLYYYPKPNAYTEIDDFALFSLRENITSENLKIESLYRNNLLHRDLRGKLHTLLRKERNIDSKILSKKFFYESRKLFNCSYTWKALEVSQEQLQYDLIDKIEEFYPYPIYVNIATLNICNLECVMCPMFSPTLKDTIQTDFFKQKQVLDESVVYKVIDFISQNTIQTTAIGFIALGEPLLDKRIPKFISYARNKGIDLVTLTTNGTLLEQKGIALLKAGLNRMTISIDGATPETYKKIRGTDLEKVERGVRKCVEYARILNNQGADIEFNLNCVLVNKEIEKEKELYLNKWSDCRDIITNIYFTNMAIFDSEGVDTNKKQSAIAYNQSYTEICSLPWLGMQMDCYGDAYVCCIMQDSAFYNNKIAIGNVIENTPQEVWNSAKAKVLRKESSENSFSTFKLCANCGEKYRTFFKDDGSALEINISERY